MIAIAIAGTGIGTEEITIATVVTVTIIATITGTTTAMSSGSSRTASSGNRTGSRTCARICSGSGLKTAGTTVGIIGTMRDAKIVTVTVEMAARFDPVMRTVETTTIASPIGMVVDPDG